MPLVLYDSYTQKTRPVDETKLITIYDCGPTVYNDVHIGNVRPMITFDVLVKYLRYKQDQVRYVQNLTDIDDKIINKAKQENKTESQISEFYSEQYIKLMAQLNAIKPDVMPKVSENIDDIIDFVDQLVKKNKAYVADDGDVYFSIDSVRDTYGKLSKQNLDELIDGVRKTNKKNKANSLDFVLWKKTDTGLNWKSPWNDHGRPGWHTECVLFVNKYLDKSITIHGGGIDLIFPHHENENAQNEALNGCGLADFWMHTGHINVDGIKMSKSLNNFILAKDILKKYSSNVIRWYMFQTTYRNPLNFSQVLIDQAKENLEKLMRSINTAIINLKLNNIKLKRSKVVSQEFIKAMDRDLNFPNAVTVIIEQVKTFSILFRNKDFTSINSTIDSIFTEFDVLGIKYELKFSKEDLKIIANWKKAIKRNDYTITDSCRKYFIDKKII